MVILHYDITLEMIDFAYKPLLCDIYYIML